MPHPPRYYPPVLTPDIRAILRRLWEGDALLTGTGLFLLSLLVPISLGLLVDSREITGAPAWLKPGKFAISTAIYTLTLAWIFGYLREWPRMRRVVSRTTAAVLVFEVAVIALQAARGTTSHFNVATPFDAVIFTSMGIAIFVQTFASIAVAVALWRQRFADPALGFALRLGMTITIVGAFVGGMMTTPTAAQLEAAQAGGRMTISGAHTVGAPDGGPGLPITGWSTQHGDIRVAHFIGLHALQVLPLITMLLFRGRDDRTRVLLTFIAAAVYAGLFAGLLAQALMGRPLVALG